MSWNTLNKKYKTTVNTVYLIFFSRLLLLFLVVMFITSCSANEQNPDTRNVETGVIGTISSAPGSTASADSSGSGDTGNPDSIKEAGEDVEEGTTITTNSAPVEIVKYAGTDSLGRSVVLGREPERVVIAGKATLIAADAVTQFTEIRNNILAMGLTNQGLGDFYSLLMPEFAGQERLPHSVSAEEIASLNPDLVFMKDRNFNSLGKALETLGIPVFSLHLENPESYIHETLELGNLLGRQQEAGIISNYYLTGVNAITETLSEAGLQEKDMETVLLLYASNADGVTAFQVPPRSWIQTYMVETAGAIPAWTDVPEASNWQKVSFEQISQWNPDRIYIISYKQPTSIYLEEIAASSLWNDLKASITDQIKGFPADYHNWAQPDSRWLLGLVWLAYDLHPDLFPSSDFHSDFRDFYRSLYHIDDEQTLDILWDTYKESISW